MKTSKKQSGRFSVYCAALQWSNAFQSDIGNFRLNLVNTTVLSGWASPLRIGFDAVGDRVSDVLLGDHPGNVAPTGDPAPAHVAEIDMRLDRILDAHDR